MSVENGQKEVTEVELRYTVDHRKGSGYFVLKGWGVVGRFKYEE